MGIICTYTQLAQKKGIPHQKRTMFKKKKSGDFPGKSPETHNGLKLKPLDENYDVL